MAIHGDEARIGRYQIAEELGRGSMGVVHLAHDPLMCRDVAVKTIFLPHHLAQAERDKFQMKFLQEARTAGCLTHPGIVTIYDFDKSPETGLPFIAMEYVEGRTLHEVFTTDGPMPWERAFSMIDTLADALASAHRSGIVHQDIKPANILVRDSDGAAKITDFGIARMHATNQEDDGPTYGSPAYMAPERIQGLPSDARSDLFSLAVIFYEALCGMRPFGGEDSTTICQAITQKAPVPITQRDPRLAPGLNRFFEQALAKDPSRRTKDATSFKRELDLAYCEQKMFSDGVSTIQMSIPGIAPVTSSPAPAARGEFMEWLCSAPLQSVPWLQSLPGTFMHRWMAIGIGAVLLMLVSFSFGWNLRSGTPHDASLLPSMNRSRPAIPAAAAPGSAVVPERLPDPRPAVVEQGPTTAAERPVPQAKRGPALEPQPAPQKQKTADTPTAPLAVQPASTEAPTVADLETATGIETPSLDPVPAQNVGLLQLSIRSGVKAGSLTLSVDGQEAYVTELLGEVTNPLRRVIGKDRQSIGGVIELTPGAHTIQASLSIDGKTRSHQRDLEVQLEPNETRTLRIVVGRAIGRRLSLELEEPSGPLAEDPTP